MKANPKKRLVINLVAIVIIVAVAFLAHRSYSISTPKAAMDQIDDLPRLSTMKIVEAKVDPAKVQVAIEIVGKDEPTIVADFVTLYQWGRSKFRPVKCGREYLPELCQIGEVHIFLLTTLEEDVPSPTGEPVEVYLTKLEIWLDQIQIDANLGPTAQLTSFAEIDELHNSVAQQTQGTGGGVEIKNEVFTGLK